MTGAAITFRPWAIFPMFSACPSCGAELYRVSFQEHRGWYVPEGVTYWQWCHNCTWMGHPNLHEQLVRDSG